MHSFIHIFVLSLALIPWHTPHDYGHVDQSNQVPSGNPAASIDLATVEGVSSLKTEWRYAPVMMREVEVPGRIGQGPAYQYEPREAMKPDFDDSGWEKLDPTTLRQPRGAGHVSFCWYRITMTIPERVGDFNTTGSTVVFETIVDDYGEVWVDGALTGLEGPGTKYRVGQAGGSVVSGFNAPNRLIVGRDVKPGEKITLAIFGMNAPISVAPANFIWLRYARLEFYSPDNAGKEK